MDIDDVLNLIAIIIALILTFVSKKIKIMK